MLDPSDGLAGLPIRSVGFFIERRRCNRAKRGIEAIFITTFWLFLTLSRALRRYSLTDYPFFHPQILNMKLYHRMTLFLM